MASQPPTFTLPAAHGYAAPTSAVRDDITEASIPSLPALNAVPTKATDIKNFDFGVFSEGEKPGNYYEFLNDFKKERERMQKKGIDVTVSSDLISGHNWQDYWQTEES